MISRILLSLMLGAAPVALAAQTTTPLVYPALNAPDDPAEALSRYLRQLASNPRDISALTGAGKAALEIGDANAALAFYARADEASPRNGRIKAGLGAALVQMEQPREALRLFDEAVALGVPAADIAADRGLAYDLRGDNRKAQGDYTLALRRRDDPEVTRRLALSMAIAGDRLGALTMLNPMVKTQDKAAIRVRAFVLALTGDRVGAARAAESAMPAAQARAMDGFLGRLAGLTPAQKASAVHFGHFPSTGKSYSQAELFADATPLPMAPRTLSPRPVPTPAPVATVRADTPLIPSGAPLGRDAAVAVGDTAPVSRAPRRRPGQIDEQARPTAVALASPRLTPRPTAAVPTPAPPTPPPASAIATRATTPAPIVSTQPSPPATPLAQPVAAPAAASATAPGVSSSVQVAAVERAAPAPGFSSFPPAAIQPIPLPPSSAQLPEAAPPASRDAASPSASFGPAAPTETAVTAPTRVAPVDQAPEPVSQPAATAPAPVQLAQADRAPDPVPDPAAEAARVAAAQARADAAAKAEAAARARAEAKARADAAAKAEAAARARAEAKVRADAAGKAKAEAAAKAKADAGAKVAAKVKADAAAKAKADAQAKADAKKPGGKDKLDPKTQQADAKGKDKADSKAKTQQADAKAKPDPKAKAAPERYWVQIASGTNKGELGKVWTDMKTKQAKLLGGRGAYTAPWRASNRLLTGPFKTEEEAQAFVNTLGKAGVSGIQFTSRAGANVEKVTPK